MPAPGHYATTVTRPDLFEDYLLDQIGLILRNHGVPVTVGESDTPIPIHFAFLEGTHLPSAASKIVDQPLRDLFDVPDLNATDDHIVNGTFEPLPGEPTPLAPFTAQRIDYSLHRLAHYTATSPSHFQNFVLFTNYQFYIDEFCLYARKLMAEGGGEYESFVEPGNIVTKAGDTPIRMPSRPPAADAGLPPDQARPCRHHHGQYRRRSLQRQDDHRPHRRAAPACLADARPLRGSAQHAGARRLRTGPCLCARGPRARRRPAGLGADPGAGRDPGRAAGGGGRSDRAFRLRTQAHHAHRHRGHHRQPQLGTARPARPRPALSQSRAIALDMESATIAANGFRFRVPYGTLLCVSDKPLHGELKLPGMATEFYKRQVSQHLSIGIRALEKLAEMPRERLHSRKLRSFSETAFQ
jgi:AMP nucleosidase